MNEQNDKIQKYNFLIINFDSYIYLCYNKLFSL